MAPGTAAPAASQLARKLRTFVIERYPFAIVPAAEAIEAVAGRTPLDSAAIDALRLPFAHELRRRLDIHDLSPADETTPGVAAQRRYASAVDEIVEACDGCLRRAALVQSFTADERREILRGMVLTRATDNRLKTFFTSAEVRYGDTTFQGKGFRSLGQEAIYAAGIRLRRGASYRSEDGWQGDVVAPMIRDLGLSLAMRTEPETIRRALSAQMGKSGPPMNGKDIHTGDFGCGLLPAMAPLASGALTIAGLAMAFAREGTGRVALSMHRRGRIVDGRMARSGQSVRRSASSGRLLRAEQSDSALDAGSRPVSSPSVRGQGDWLRNPWRDDRRHRSRRDCRHVRVGGRAGARRVRADADRARIDADVRSRASRRHAVSRKGDSALLDVSAADGSGIRGPGAPCVLVGEGSDSRIRCATRGRRPHRRGTSRRH